MLLLGFVFRLCKASLNIHAPVASNLSCVCPSDPHAGPGQCDPGQHDGKLHQHLPAGGNQRTVEGTSHLFNLLDHFPTITYPTSITCERLVNAAIVSYLPIRVCPSRRSGRPSWWGWSCRSMTSPRSTWSCRVTWATPSTLTSCKWRARETHRMERFLYFCIFCTLNMIIKAAPE